MPTSPPHDPGAWGQDARVMALVSAGSLAESRFAAGESGPQPEDRSTLLGLNLIKPPRDSGASNG